MKLPACKQSLLQKAWRASSRCFCSRMWDQQWLARDCLFSTGSMTLFVLSFTKTRQDTMTHILFCCHVYLWCICWRRDGMKPQALVMLRQWQVCQCDGSYGAGFTSIHNLCSTSHATPAHGRQVALGHSSCSTDCSIQMTIPLSGKWFLLGYFSRAGNLFRPVCCPCKFPKSPQKFVITMITWRPASASLLALVWDQAEKVIGPGEWVIMDWTNEKWSGEGGGKPIFCPILF